MINLFRDIPSSKPNFYFLVNGSKFYNNVEAFAEASKRRDSRIEFVLDYDVYRNPQAWRVEPLLESKDYFRKHARILAEKYDDITIHYSGGTDSHTILDAFIDEGIRNVKLWHRAGFGFEDFNPKIKLFGQIRDTLMSKYGEKLKQLNYTVEGLDKPNYLAPNDPAEWRLALENFVGDYLTMVKLPESIGQYHSRHKRVNKTKSRSCMIWGLEKPRVTLVNGDWFWATNSGMWWQYDTPSSNDYDTIFFFSTDDVPEIQIKLAWLKISAIESIVKTRGNISKSEAEKLVSEVQHFSSSYYTLINESMGYKALSRVLNGNYWRASPDYSGWLKHLHLKREKIGIIRETQHFFEEEISRRVDARYIDEENKTLNSIPSRSIYIRKSTLELRDS